MKYHTRSQGFTLVEMFVAVLVLVMAVLGPMTLFSRLISDGMYARDQVIASYLAKEGLELAIEKQNIERDDDWWGSCSEGCSIQLEQDGGINIDSGDGSLYLEGDGNQEYYMHNAGNGNRTDFKRTITVEGYGELKEGDIFSLGVAKVTSQVQWTSGLLSRNTELTSFIYFLGSNI